MATPQTIRNEATAARALIGSLAKLADLDGDNCIHQGIEAAGCVRCVARRELVDLRDLLAATSRS